MILLPFSDDYRSRVRLPIEAKKLEFATMISARRQGAMVKLSPPQELGPRYSARKREALRVASKKKKVGFTSDKPSLFFEAKLSSPNDHFDA